MPQAGKPRKERARKDYSGELMMDWGSRMVKKGVHPLLVMHAQVCGFSGVYHAEAFRELVDGSFSDLSKDFDLLVWASYYRDEETWSKRHWRYEMVNSDAVGELRELARNYRVGKVLEEADKLKETPTGPPSMDDSTFDLMFMWTMALEEMNNDMEAHEAVIQTGNDRMEDLLPQFFLTVHLPCILTCGETPGSLFKRAADGDLEALFTLISLDPQVQYISEIGRHVSRLERERKKRPELFERLQEARSGKFEHWKNSMHFKLGVVRFLFDNAKQIERSGEIETKSFTKMDLRHLFDAISRQCLRRNLEEDFPPSNEAFIKLLGRKPISRFSEDGWDISCS